MKAVDLDKFASIMYGLAEEFGGKITSGLIELKFKALLEFSIIEISKAAHWLIRNRKNTYPAFPTVKEFIDAIEKSTSSQVSINSQAIAQADLIIKFSREGRENITFNDPITNEIMDTRWKYQAWARTVKSDDLTWFKKEFIESYKSYTEGVEVYGNKFLEVPEKFKELAVKAIKQIELF